MLSKIKSFLKSTAKHKNKIYQEDFSAEIESYNDLNAKTIVVNDDQYKTLIFSKEEIKINNTTSPKTFAIISIIVGDDVGFKLNISYNRINIGRRINNEFPLKDINSSRLHAYILFENNKHILYDADSLNGTYKDGQRITEILLQHGDKFQIGNTTILYETVNVQ